MYDGAEVHMLGANGGVESYHLLGSLNSWHAGKENPSDIRHVFIR